MQSVHRRPLTDVCLIRRTIVASDWRAAAIVVHWINRSTSNDSVVCLLFLLLISRLWLRRKKMPRNWFLLLHWQQTALNRPDVSYISRDLLFPSKSGKDDDMKTDCDRHSLATETLSTVSEGGRGGGGEGSVPGGTIVNCSRLKGHLSSALPPDGVTIATLLNWTKYTGALSEMKDINFDARRWSVQSYVFKRVHDWTDIFRIRPMMLWYIWLIFSLAPYSFVLGELSMYSRNSVLSSFHFQIDNHTLTKG